MLGKKNKFHEVIAGRTGTSWWMVMGTSDSHIVICGTPGISDRFKEYKKTETVFHSSAEMLCLFYSNNIASMV